MQTEHWFDITGSITYVVVAVLAVSLRDMLDARSALIAVYESEGDPGVRQHAVWALAKLGEFEYLRGVEGQEAQSQVRREIEAALKAAASGLG